MSASPTAGVRPLYAGVLKIAPQGPNGPIPYPERLVYFNKWPTTRSDGREPLAWAEPLEVPGQQHRRQALPAMERSPRIRMSRLRRTGERV